MSFISILRGINVSGKNILKMDALKQMLSTLKMENVRTYIQSGNIVFDYPKTDTAAISEMLRSNINKHFGLDIPVITLQKDEWEQIILANPFAKDKSKNLDFLHVSFLSETPHPDYIELLKKVDANADECIVIGKAAYLYCPGGYGKTKLSNNFLEKKFKVATTTRNWKTVNILLEMAGK